MAPGQPGHQICCGVPSAANRRLTHICLLPLLPQFEGERKSTKKSWTSQIQNPPKSSSNVALDGWALRDVSIEPCTTGLPFDSTFPCRCREAWQSQANIRSPWQQRDEALLLLHLLHHATSQWAQHHFQAHETRLPYIAPEIRTLLRRTMGRFVNTKLLRTTSDVNTVPCHQEELQLGDDFLALGIPAKAYLHEHQDDIEPAALSRVFASARSFYITACKKIIQKFPFSDPVMNSLTFLISTERGDVNPSTSVSVCERFSSVIPAEDIPLIEEEFRYFQICPDTGLPAFTDGESSIDTVLGSMCQLKNRITRFNSYGIKFCNWSCRLVVMYKTKPTSF